MITGEKPTQEQFGSVSLFRRRLLPAMPFRIQCSLSEAAHIAMIRTIFHASS